MIKINTLLGYQITEQIYAGTRTIVYRGVRESVGTDPQCKNPQPVIIKLLQNDYPTFSELLQFRNQYTITKNLNSPLIIQTYSLEPYQNSYGLVMEDFGGISLHQWAVTGEKSLSLREFLELAIALCDSLALLDRERIIHKDIKPSNILINPETNQVKLIDFSIASLLPREPQTLISPNGLEGTLAYISPEQTGRMNRGIDYRTDLYSLGVTFYELLTKELPFQTNDPMELVYCHMAKTAPQVHEIKPEIPAIISEIVRKLMAKNAEDRYQSALGLKFDLETCLGQLQEHGEIKSFPIAQRDVSDRFMIPDQLYGRETEVETLLQAFERVSTGNTEMMLVAGFSGIGKTAVINEVHKPIVRQRGYFIKGKYDQFQRNIPFSAFVQAFRDLIGQLYSESEAQLQTWQSQILTAVGENGQVLIEVIPELENIIGKQPPLPELSGNAAQNRFNLLMQKFVQVFTSKKHPLVIFLDDLQWADSASLNLLQLLMQDTGHLLILGAYRDNEVFPAHPLLLTVDKIVKAGAIVNKITLLPLSKLDTKRLVTDTLNCDSSLAKPLTKLIYQKTQGNPFFITQFLKALYDDQIITFDWETQHWQCDIAQVKILAITNDVVEFMTLQLQKLPTQTQDILKLAACIGTQFDLNTLIIVSEKSAGMTATILWKALQEEFIIPITKIYKLFTQSADQEVFQVSVNPTYRFLHDRVQQAAYSLIPDEQKQSTHLKIGQLLLKNTSVEEREEHIFTIVNQLNSGKDLITQTAERDQLVQLNLIAAQKAKISTAYGAATEYLEICIHFLPEDSWKSQTDLTRTIYELAAEVAYLSTNYQQMEQLVELILSHTDNLIDKIRVYEIKMLGVKAQAQLRESLQIGLQILQFLGIEFPAQPTPDDIGEALERTLLTWKNRSILSLLNLPVMTDPIKLAAMRILTQMIAPAYQSFPILMPLLIFKQIELSISSGNCEISAFSYADYGLVLCGIVGDLAAGYQFGQLALTVLDRFQVKAYKCRTYFIVHSYISHWKNSLSSRLPFFQEAYQVGLETGDLESSALNAQMYCAYAYFAGNELTTLATEMETYRQGLLQLKQETALNFQAIYHQAVLNLLGRSVDVCQLDGEVYQETQTLPILQQLNFHTALYYLYYNKTVLCYLFRQYQQAADCAVLAESYSDGMVGMFAVPLFCFYSSLIYLELSGSITEFEQHQYLEKVRSNQEKLKRWSEYSPMNHLHKWYLVEAEKNRVFGNKNQAIEYYDRAISGAKENQFLHEEALANELTAKFYWEWNKEKVAQAYMIEAYYCYARWGATAKVQDLEQRYPQLLTPITKQSRSSISFEGTISQGIGSSNCSSTSISEALDLAAILKSSQAISVEIELNQLLTTLLKIVITNAGADKCVLLLKQDSSLQVVAIIEEGQSPQLLPQIPLELSQDVAISLVNTVKNSLETLVIVDPNINSLLVGDRYFEQHQPQSILCTPILHQGQLIGILYLENNLTFGAFTSERVKVLNLICSQAAISLENARLYQASQQALTELKQAQLKIVQSEKMSALGNLVAGVAHEINNPIGFLAGNINPALDYINDLFELINLFQQKFPQLDPDIEAKIATIHLDYIREDLPKLIGSMKEGVKRIKDISISLRTFSRADSDRPISANIEDGINSTIMILKHRLKATECRPEIQIIKDYGDLPPVECYPGQLNQVFMNLLANAIDALDESNLGRSFTEIQTHPNQIIIQTELSGDRQWAIIKICDNGIGMTDQVKSKIFDHLFTTKEVSKGTGLGLAIAREIIVEKHAGTIEVNSTLGQGTEFVITIPIKA